MDSLAPKAEIGPRRKVFLEKAAPNALQSGSLCAYLAKKKGDPAGTALSL